MCTVGGEGAGGGLFGDELGCDLATRSGRGLAAERDKGRSLDGAGLGKSKVSDWLDILGGCPVGDRKGDIGCEAFGCDSIRSTGVSVRGDSRRLLNDWGDAGGELAR